MTHLSYVSRIKFICATGLLAGLSICGAANPASAHDAVAISGTFDCTYVKKDVAVIGAPQDAHVLVLSVCQGKNTNKGAGDYLDGASVLNQEIDDLAQGNGPQIGYATFTKGADSTRVRHEGQALTTLNADKTPNTTLKGKWTFVSGTGQYTGVAGSGTYTGKVLSDTTFEVDWEGYLSLESQSSAAQ